MLNRKTILACGATGILALAVACGNHNQNPVSPTTGATLPDSGAAADGSTLKVDAPTPKSPTGGAKLDTNDITLTLNNVQAKYASISLAYRFQVFNAGGNKVYESGLVSAGSGGTTSHTVTGTLDFNANHTWRARAEYSGAFGPWSAAAAFKTPEGGYIKGTEVYDPLTTGKTVGEVQGGGKTWLGTNGVRFDEFGSRIAYQLSEALQEGEYSLMATGIDEGSPGEKSKVMCMAEGWGDPTANDYRFSAELRARSYPEPGSIRFRMIVGSARDGAYIRDSRRIQVNLSDEKWYLWRLSWANGWGRLEVREGGPNGPAVYDESVATNGHPYRPDPHVIYVGAPVGRGGEDDSTIPGLTVKNVWISSRPRPNGY